MATTDWVGLRPGRLFRMELTSERTYARILGTRSSGTCDWAADFPEAYVAGVSTSPWRETLGVYVDAHRGFQVNGKLIKKDKLEEKLKEELGERMVWTVYVEADRDSVFEDTVFAMDTIQGLGAKVVWITPRMREEWGSEAADHQEKREAEGSERREKDEAPADPYRQ